jgi:heptosyltransferase-2
MKIGIIQTRPGIGDFCIFLPIVQQISKFYNSKVTLITKKRSFARELTLDDPHIEKVIYIKDKNNNFNLYKHLRKEKFEYVFIFHFSFRYYLISLVSGIKNIFYYGFFKQNVQITNYAKLKLSKWLNNKFINNYECKLFYKKQNNIDNSNNIILGIGGSGNNKKWDIVNYIDIIKKIDLNNNQIILAGGKFEMEDANFLISFFKSNIISLCNLNLPDTLQYIQGSKLYLGNDTGFMHLSGALGVRSFGLFGDTPSDYTDYNNLIIPIMPKSKKKITHGDNMMNEIYPEHVFEVIKDFL